MTHRNILVYVHNEEVAFFTTFNELNVYAYGICNFLRHVSFFLESTRLRVNLSARQDERGRVSRQLFGKFSFPHLNASPMAVMRAMFITSMET